MKWIVYALILGVCLLSPAIAQADSIRLGIFSFNAFIPGNPGVNSFDVSNRSGGLDLPPTFPVSSTLSFLNANLALKFSDGTIQNFFLGTLGPGHLLDAFGNPRVQFASSTAFIMATLTGTLDQASFTLFNGSTFVVDSPLINVDLIPSPGSNLVAGKTFAPITVTSVPEPSTLLLLGSGLAALFGWSRRKRIVAGGDAN